MIAYLAKSIKWGYVTSAGVSWQGKREAHLLFMRLLPLDSSASAVSERTLRDRVWQVQQPRFTAGLRCSAHSHPLQGSIAHNSRYGFSALFLGYGPDWHLVEAGHWSRRQAWGVWLQPPSERARAAEAAGARRREEAASDPGAGEGPAGTAAAGRGNGRVHTAPTTQRPTAVGRHTSRDYKGTAHGRHDSCRRGTTPTLFDRLKLR